MDELTHLLDLLELEESDDLDYISYLYPEYVNTFPLPPVFLEIEDYEDTDIYNEYNILHPLKVFVNHKGIPYYKINGKSVLQKTRSTKGIYVLDKYNNLYMTTRHFHHSDVLSGSDIVCAGEYKLNNHGQIINLNNKSGHYKPLYYCLTDVLQNIRQNGYKGFINTYTY